MNLNKYFTLNKKYFGIGLIIILIVNYNTFLGEKPEADIGDKGNKNIEIVSLGEIKESIEVVGDAELIDEQSLTFNKVATVTDVYFEAGDAVKKGETIARIDDSDAYRSIEEAKINLENAKINLNQLYEPVDESNLKQAENAILTAENNLDIAKKEFENLKTTQLNSSIKLEEEISTKEKELENIKQEKANSYTTKESSKNTTIVNIEDNLKSYLVDIEEIIDESDTILGVSNEKKQYNDHFETYLGVKDLNLKNNAKIYLITSIGLYDDLKIKFDNYDYSGDKENLLNVLNDYLELFNKLYLTTDNLYKTIDNSIASVGSLSDSDINSMKSTISGARSKSLSQIDSINSNINSLNGLTDIELELSSNELSIETLELSLVNAKKDLETQLIKYEIEYEAKEDDIKSKEEKLKIEKLSLEELLEGPTQANITKARNSVSQAEIKLASAYEDLEDYILVAPFDGVIRKIDYMPGDNLKNENDKYVYIENPNLFEVIVKLDQIDIVEVEIGDTAIVTFDTYITTPVKARIGNIDTTPVKNSGVVSYEVKLILDDPDFDKKILSGMTADVEIINELKEDILLLKTSAINTVLDKKMVNTEKDGDIKSIEIETGLSSNGMTEIISGLNEGDSVIVGDFSVGEKEESTTLFGTPGTGKGRERPQ